MNIIDRGSLYTHRYLVYFSCKDIVLTKYFKTYKEAEKFVNHKHRS